MRLFLAFCPNLTEFHEGKKLPLWKKLWLLFTIPFFIFIYGIKIAFFPTTAKDVANKISGMKLPDGRTITITGIEDDGIHFSYKENSECTFGVDPTTTVKTNVKDIFQMIEELEALDENELG